MIRQNRRASPETRATALLGPLACLSLTTTLACVDAIVLTDSGAARSPIHTPINPPDPDGGATGSPSIGPSVPAKALFPSQLRVRLGRANTGETLRLSVDGGWRLHVGSLTERAPGALIAIGDALKDAQIDGGADWIRVNGEVLPHAAVTLIPDRSGALSIHGRSYRGVFLLEGSTRGVDVVNLVDLEDYVAGVLHAEMPSRFPIEARRAQAVAARTYALFHTARGRDLRDDQGSQVYRGTEMESADARQIVASTAGEVLTFGGVPFETYFHSTCGGTTSSARRVFGPATPPPLDGGVACDACSDSPRYRWTAKVDPSRVKALYHGVMETFDLVRIADADPGGRALTLEFLDAAGTPLDRTSADRFRNDYNVGLPLSAQLLSALWTSVRRGDSALIVDGRGFGHGIGLCQYGAGGYARRGTTYRDILTHYYPGSQVTRLDG